MVGFAWPLQSVDPTLILELPGLVRGVAAFAIVLAVGTVLLWRYAGLVDRSIAASIDRPLSSLGYGIAAHLTIGFFGVYAASQLGQLTFSGRSLGGLGLLAGLGVLTVVAALGFTVVGTAIVEFRGAARREYGLLLGAAIAGVAAFTQPLLGGLVWLIVVSTGIGGPVRVWFHAAEDVEAAS